MRRLRLAGIAALLLLAFLALNARPCHATSQVLIIHSYHSGLGWTDAIMAGIRDTFSQSGKDIQMSAEYLDARRYVDPERVRLIRSAIIEKLKGQTPDLVMVSDNDAFNFVLTERERLFPRVPVVFLGVNHFASSMIAGRADITGVAEKESIVETVALALSLHPGTREIVVIGRTSLASDRANRGIFAEALPDLPKDVAITFWDDLPLKELEKRLRLLKAGTVVFLNGLITDEKGRQMMFREATHWIHDRCAVPLYSLWDAFFKFGIVGGKLVSSYEQGRKGAELALRVLGGEKAGAIPVVRASDVNRYMFDYRELERFDIPLSRLPKDALIINRPDSIYETHRTFLLTIGAVLILLFGLVLLLGITIIRRRRAEEALMQANVVVENSPAVLFRWRATEGWPVELVSRNVSRFGYDAEELLSGKIAYSALIHPDDLERTTAEMNAYCAAGADGFVQEYRLVTRDGKVRWIYDRTVVERDASGQAAFFQGVVMDVTEREEAKQKLREKTDELDRFFTVSLDLFCIADTDGYFRRLNPQWEAVLGYSLSELEGRRFFDFVHPDDIEPTTEAMTELQSQRAVKDFVNRFRREDGAYRWIEWQSYPMGTLIYAAARDITERREAEEALRKSEEKYRDIFERAAEGIFQSTPDGRFLSVNPSFAQMLGYASPEELIGKITDLAHQFYVHPEERESFTRALEASPAVLTGFVHEFYRKDGGTIWISTNARAVRDEEGRVLYYEGTSENITERKLAEDEIRRLNEELEQRVEERTAQLEAANKELEAFSYSVSHDLRAPLRAISGYTRILSEDYALTLDEEGIRVCNVIEESALRMGRLIDDLLAFSRLGRASMQPGRIDMAALAESVFYDVTPPETRDRIDFRVGALPPAHADPTLIRQVWANLISNAVKFSSKREKAVIEAGASKGDGETVYFVRDNGAGFDMAYRDKLFGVFQRLHSEREFEGTGVGLAIVQRVIHRHGGRVWAESTPDQGAGFFFTLPAKGD